MKSHLTIADPMPWAIAYSQRGSPSFRYDDTNRLTKLVHSETTTAPTSGWGSDPLAGYAFVYDSSSRIASIDSYLDGLSEYSHDDTNQLVGADHNTAADEAYEYDASANRIMSGYDNYRPNAPSEWSGLAKGGCTTKRIKTVAVSPVCCQSGVLINQASFSTPDCVTLGFPRRRC